MINREDMAHTRAGVVEIEQKARWTSSPEGVVLRELCSITTELIDLFLTEIDQMQALLDAQKSVSEPDAEPKGSYVNQVIADLESSGMSNEQKRAYARMYFDNLRSLATDGREILRIDAEQQAWESRVTA